MRKDRFVCRFILVGMCLCFPSKGWTQVWDDFSDGNWSSAPAWDGDTSQFVVLGGMLQLNSAGSDSSFLSTPFSAMGDTTEWRLRMKLTFAPSSSNYARFYLCSDQNNLDGPLNGYFLQFGESGSADAIVLYKQIGWSLTAIARAKDSAIANFCNVGVKVLRFPGGLWTLATDYSGGVSFSTEATAIDAQFNTSTCIGIKTVYTSSNATKFFLDDVYAGPYLYDTIPPQISHAVLIEDSTIQIQWNEALENISAFDLNNYFIDALGTPYEIINDSANANSYFLKFNQAFSSGSVYTLKITNVEDVNGNAVLDTLKILIFKTSAALPADVIINEIMSNPTSAPSLPPYEYLEIYNRSNKIINLSSFTLSDPSTSGTLPADTLFPGQYRCYTSSTEVSYFLAAGFSNVKGLSSFPSLNNDGDRIQLSNAQGNLIDEVQYDLSMYRDPLKDDHGWSLERVDPIFPCSDNNNWGASHSLSGGTPGFENSIVGNYSDTISPYPVYAILIDSLHLEIGFSEYLDTVDANNVNYYSISNYSGTILDVQFVSENSTVILTVDQVFQRSEIYIVYFDEALHDCAGNILKRYFSLQFAFDDSIQKGDVVINEILFDPFPEGCDFVEVYNAGKKIIDLSQLIIAHADPLVGIAMDAVAFCTMRRLLFPGEFAIVASTPDGILKFYNIADSRLMFACNLPSFNDDEGVVILLNKSLQEIDRFHYKDDFHFPLLSDPEGVSLERISPFINSGDSSNWHSAALSSAGATPCKINSQYYDYTQLGSDRLQVYPELFSPDNDGFHDVLGIRCTAPKSGYMVAITVYNDRGYPVRSISKHELMGMKAEWIWDGLSDDQVLQPHGIYIVFLEMFHIDGDVKRIKKACVLAKYTN